MQINKLQFVVHASIYLAYILGTLKVIFVICEDPL